jgi:hypothetical protein
MELSGARKAWRASVGGRWWRNSGGWRRAACGGRVPPRSCPESVRAAGAPAARALRALLSALVAQPFKEGTESHPVGLAQVHALHYFIVKVHGCPLRRAAGAAWGPPGGRRHRARLAAPRSLPRGVSAGAIGTAGVVGVVAAGPAQSCAAKCSDDGAARTPRSLASAGVRPLLPKPRMSRENRSWHWYYSDGGCACWIASLQEERERKS